MLSYILVIPLKTGRLYKMDPKMFQLNARVSGIMNSKGNEACVEVFEGHLIRRTCSVTSPSSRMPQAEMLNRAG